MRMATYTKCSHLRWCPDFYSNDSNSYRHKITDSYALCTYTIAYVNA